MYTPGFNERPLVSVRSTIYQTPKQSTFTNFLFNHGLLRLGDEWRETQNQLPLAEQHPLFVLHCQANHFVSKQPRQPGGHVSVVPNGPLSFCERFYYDLYTVDDNNVLQEELLKRLRDRDQFQGAMHELFVEATCLRAGFSIIREVHQGLKPKNVEFIAVTGTDRLAMRVWERGVGETQSCGTGACASAAVAHRRGLVGEQVQVDVLGGSLTVVLGANVRLGGPVVHVVDVVMPREALLETLARPTG